MVDPSSLSLAAVGLRIQLAKTAGVDENRVMIGSPHVAVKQQENHLDSDYLSLFFYRVEYGAYPADGGADEPFYLRAYCLVTAIGGERSSDQPSSGEIELRVMGAVMAELHRHPILMLKSGDAEEPVAQLQVVPANLSLDDINHLWATQGGATPYRLSVAYEIALLPAPLFAQPKKEPPRVGAVSVLVRPVDLIQPVLPKEGFGVSGAPVRAPYIHVDVKRPDWAPHLCFLDEEGNAVYTLCVASGDSQKKVKVIALGEAGTSVDLKWEIWKRGGIWQMVSKAPAQHKVLGPTLNPDDLPSPEEEMGVILPLSEPGQALLRATRSWRPPEKETDVILSSNPLLVTLE